MPSAIMSTQTSTYLEAVKQRRSVYGVTDDVAVSDDRILEIANAVIQTCPSAWNMQSTRMLISLGQEHKHFWNTVIASAKPSVVESQQRPLQVFSGCLWNRTWSLRFLVSLNAQQTACC
jgi:predicted oxidoreductase (fatty acid repression mutant protein)